MQNKIEVRDFSFFYGSFQALKNLNLGIREKHITALIGPSGCGKSTFLRCLNRMNDTIRGTRAEGTVLLDGKDAARLHTARGTLQDFPLQDRKLLQQLLILLPAGIRLAAQNAQTGAWRIHQHTPRHGEVAVFNRSHYEDVLVVRVENLVPEAVWSRRYAQINDFEAALAAGGTRVVKLFLHISRDEQKLRFQERLQERSKQWKFDPADLDKRARWDDYRLAFEAAISRCSTEGAPWYVIPADRKWFRDFAVSQVLRQELERLPLRWPKPEFDPKTIRIE